jgi:LysM domain
MSLTIAPPSVTRRALTSGRRVGRAAGSAAARPQLRVVRDDEVPSPAGAGARRAARAGVENGPRSGIENGPRSGVENGARARVENAARAGRRPGAEPVGESLPPIRLTRRGRVVVRAGVVLMIVLALAGGVLLMGRSAQAGSTPTRVTASYRVVLPGETLWQIAGEVAPGVDRRDTVADILELNALSSAEVFAGQRIAVPVRSSKSKG